MKEKNSKFDDKGESTIGKNSRKDSKCMNMLGIKNPASVDEGINDIRVYNRNSRSIRNKIDLLRVLASVENVHIIAISATWLDSAVKNFATEFKINRYTIYHKDKIGRVEKWVAIYVKNTITSYVSRDVKLDVNSESIWVKIIKWREKLTMGNIYKSPNLSRETSTLLFQKINAAAKYRKVCIMRDFN